MVNGTVVNTCPTTKTYQGIFAPSTPAYATTPTGFCNSGLSSGSGTGSNANWTGWDVQTRFFYYTVTADAGYNLVVNQINSNLRSSGTGPRVVAVEWNKALTGTWTQVAISNITNTSNTAVNSAANLGIVVNDGETLYIRYRNTSTVSGNGGTVSSTGTHRINSGSIEGTFTPAAAAPTVTTTDPIPSVASTSATFEGNITATGSPDVTRRGFTYITGDVPAVEESTSGSIEVEETPGPYSTGTYTLGATSLTPSTLYTVRAFAENATDISYGAPVTFTTTAPPATPTLVLSDASGPVANAGSYNFGLDAQSVEGFRQFTITNTGAGALTGLAVTGLSGQFSLSTGLSATSLNQNQTATFTVQYARTAVADHTGSFTVTSNTPNYVVNLSGQTADLPSVTTNPAAAIQATSATLDGNVTAANNSTVTARGFVYKLNSVAGDPDLSDNVVTHPTGGTGAYDDLASGLTAGTTYKYRAYATNGVGTNYGGVETFTTAAIVNNDLCAWSRVVVDGVPSNYSCSSGSLVSNGFGSAGPEIYFTVSPVLNLEGSNATINFRTVNRFGDAGALTWANTTDGLYDLVYSTDYAGDPATATWTAIAFNKGAESTSSTLSAVNNVSVDLSSLIGNSNLRLAFRNRDNGGTNSKEVTVSNLEVINSGPVVAPVVTTSAPTNVTNALADFNGEVVSSSAPLSARGFVYTTGLNADPTLANTVVTSATTALGTYTENVSGLAASTDYSVRAYATNNAGTSYGANQNFTTAAPPATPTLVLEDVDNPNPGYAVNGTYDFGVDLNSNNGTRQFTIRNTGVATLNISNVSTTGARFSISSALSSSSLTTGQTATFTVTYTRSVVADHTGTVVIASNDPTNPTFTLNLEGQTAQLPTVTTAAASSVAATTAQLNGEVTAENNSAVTDRGFVLLPTSDMNTPDLNNATVVTAGSGLGVYDASATSLSSETEYKYRAYATSAVGTSYGSVETFTTLIAPVVLAGWEITGTTGAEPFNPSTLATGVTSSGITRGAGVVITTAGDSWGSNGWDGPTDLAGAVAADHFHAFTITPDFGKQISFTEIAPYNIRRSGSGPSTGQWQFQVGSDPFQTIGSPIAFTITTSSGNNLGAIDLSSIPELQDVTEPVTIRMVAWGATASGGTFYFRQWTTGEDLIVSGILQNAPGAPLLVVENATNNVDTLLANNANLTYPAYFADIVGTKTIKVKNDGTAALTGITFTRTSGDNQFTVGTTAPASIAAGDSANVTIEFSRAVVGTGASAVFTLESAELSDFVINVSGDVLSPLAVFDNTDSLISASSTVTLAGGTQNDAVNRVISIKNNGGSTITISSIVRQSGSTDFTVTGVPATVAAGNTETFTVTHSRATLGNQTATIRILSSVAASSPFDFNIEGNVVSAPVAPTVATSAPSAIKAVEATANGDITDDGGSAITERGFVLALGTDADPDAVTFLQKEVVTPANQLGVYEATFSGLTPETEYKVRAYAINSVGTTLGTVETFTTNAAFTGFTLIYSGCATNCDDFPSKVFDPSTPNYGTAGVFERKNSLGATSGSGSISSNAWTPNTYLQWSVDANTGYDLLIDSVNVQARASSTGPRDMAVEYFIGTDTVAASWTNYFNYTNTTSNARKYSGLKTLFVAEGQSIYFRLRPTSTVSVGGGTVSGTGSARFENNSTIYGRFRDSAPAALISVRSADTLYTTANDTLNFGTANLAVNNSQTVWVRNTNAANGSLELENPTLSGSTDYSLDLTGFNTSVAVGDSTSFVINYNRSTAGVQNALVTLSSNALNNDTVRFTLNGTGVSVDPVLVVKFKGSVLNSGDNYDFAADFIGRDSTATFSILNEGINGLNVTALGTTGAQFSAASSFSNPIAQGDSVTFTVNYARNAVGSHTGTVAFTTNDPSNTNFSLDLEGVTNALAAPTVATVAPITGIGGTGAVLLGNVTSDGGVANGTRGFVYRDSTGTGNFIIGDAGVSNLSEAVSSIQGEYQLTATGLTVSFAYEYRAYAITSQGTTYGDVETFSTNDGNNAFTLIYNGATGGNTGPGADDFLDKDFNPEVDVLTNAPYAQALPWTPVGGLTTTTTSGGFLIRTGWDVADRYWEFPVVANAGHDLVLSDMEFQTQGSGTAPQFWAIEYKMGEAGSWSQSFTFSQTASSAQTKTGSLGNLTVLEGDTVFFRMIPTDNTLSVNNGTVQNGGTWRVLNGFTVNGTFRDALPTPAVTFSDAAVNITATGLDFGVDNVNANESKTITITNVGNGTLNISSLGLGASSSSDYSINTTSTALTLAPAATTTFEVTYSRATVGVATGTVELAGNTITSPVVLNLTGETEPLLYFRTAPTATAVDGTLVSTWESSTDDVSYSAAATVPALNNQGVLINVPVYYDANATLSRVTVEAAGELEIRNAATLTVSDAAGVDLIVNGTLTHTGTGRVLMGAGATAEVGATGRFIFAGAASGGSLLTATWDPASTFEIANTGNRTSYPVGMNQTFGNVEVNQVGQTSSAGPTGALTSIAGNLIIKETNTGSFRLTASADLTLNVGGDLIIEKGQLQNSGSSGSNVVVNVGGNLVVGNGNGTAIYDLANATGTRIVNVTGDLIIGDGGFLSRSSATPSLNVSGNLIMTGTGQFGTGMSNANLVMNGTAPQTISTNSNPLRKLVINNNASTLGDRVVTLLNTINVSDSIVIVSGILDTDGETINLASGATITGETEGNKILGTVSITRDVTTATTNDFGNIGTTITFNNAPGLTTITRRNGSAYTVNSNNSMMRNYDIDTENSGLDATLVFSYLNEELNGIDPENLQLIRSTDNGTTWEAYESTADTAAKTITVTNINAFSIWSAQDENAPLPVDLISFNAALRHGATYLNWATATEKNNKGFYVERSYDNAEYVEVGFVAGAGNSQNRLAYDFRDENNQSAYYRLRQVDFDGTASYSPVVFVKAGEETKFTATASPNPFFSKVTLNMSGIEATEQLSAVLTTMNGSAVHYAGEAINTATWLNGELNRKPAGMYMLTLRTANGVQNIRLIKE